MKRRILFSIAIIILIAPLVYVAVSLINFGYNYINFLDMPGPCNSRVRGITRDSNHSVEYQWMPDGSAIVIMNKIGSAQLGTRFDLVNIDEGTVEKLLTYPESYPEPSVDNFILSPSGQYIAIPEKNT